MDLSKQADIQSFESFARDLKLRNSITAGVLDKTIKQWVHMVCGLWTPGTRCPNVDTMSAFDVSGASCLGQDMVRNGTELQYEFKNDIVPVLFWDL